MVIFLSVNQKFAKNKISRTIESGRVFLLVTHHATHKKTYFRTEDGCYDPYENYYKIAEGKDNPPAPERR